MLGTFLSNYGVFLFYWGLLLVLCVVEYVICRPGLDLGRKRRWPVNFALSAFLIAASTLAPLSSFVVSKWAEANTFGLFYYVQAPELIQLLLSILVLNFASYLFHYISHVVPVLWRVHSVHHSDHQLDVTTTLRAHPIEPVVSAVFGSVFIVVLGISPLAIIINTMLETVVVMFSHSHIMLPERFERIVRQVFTTPALHHIHHSAEQVETDSNFSNVFPFFDRLFGTYREPPYSGAVVARYGLHEISPEQASNLDAQLLQPFTLGQSMPAQTSKPIAE